MFEMNLLTLWYWSNHRVDSFSIRYQLLKEKLFRGNMIFSTPIQNKCSNSGVNSSKICINFIIFGLSVIRSPIMDVLCFISLYKDYKELSL